MKLRLLKHDKKIYMLCQNGSILIPSERDMIQLLTSFSRPHSFKGNDGYWNKAAANMENAEGETLAYIDDANKLVVLNEKTFSAFAKQEQKYISATEYAELHGKSRPSVKNMCAAGRIPGAYKTSSGWLIPADAPYPKDGRAGRVVKKA